MLSATYYVAVVAVVLHMGSNVSGDIERKGITKITVNNSSNDSSELIDRNKIDHIEEIFLIPSDVRPYIDLSGSKNVTAIAGNTAQLNCRVKNLGNKTVSWIRHKDIHLLTTGIMTYTSDQRFYSVHNPHTEDWMLKIRFPNRRDSGVYECQVSTTPPIGHSMYLSVVDPVTTIVGAPELYINKGSTINLTCVVIHSPQPSPIIKWTHNDEIISYDSARGGVSVIVEKSENTKSFLLVQRARGTDSGRYTCTPTNANPKTVLVHVLNGEYPAAMQQGGQLRLEHPVYFILLTITITVINR